MHAHQRSGTALCRLLPGKDTWWFLGPGGTARLGQSQVAGDGTLRPAARQRLRELGLCDEKKPQAYSLTVLTSTDCNLGCGYCFQNTAQDPAGGFRPPRLPHARLTSLAITDVLEFARGHMSAAGLSKLHVVLFGGEPLLNPRGCEELLRRAVGYGLASAHMISNLTVVTAPLAKRLSGHGLASIQVTFDGDRDDHDRTRATRAGGATFDLITRNIAAASEATPLRWLLRVNVSEGNRAGIDSLIVRLAAIVDPARCTMSFSPIADAGIGYPVDLKPAPALADHVIRWHREALEAGFSVPAPRSALPCQTCGYQQGKYGAVVAADGTLSSCWETAGRAEWSVGSVTTGYLPAREVRDRWVGCLGRHDRAWEPGSFQDKVDAALLDHLREAGRLRPASGENLGSSPP